MFMILIFVNVNPMFTEFYSYYWLPFIPLVVSKSTPIIINILEQDSSNCAGEICKLKPFMLCFADVVAGWDKAASHHNFNVLR